jgi:hypothetical protein
LPPFANFVFFVVSAVRKPFEGRGVSNRVFVSDRLLTFWNG